MKSDQKRVNYAQGLFAGKTQTAAALAAGYKPGRGLRVMASHLAKHPEVQAEIARLRTLADGQAILARAEALKLLTSHARGSLENFIALDPQGGITFDLFKAKKLNALSLLKKLKVKDLKTFDPETGESVPAGQEIEIELHDPQAAIAQLSRLEGWNSADKHEVRHIGPQQLTDDEVEKELKALGYSHQEAWVEKEFPAGLTPPQPQETADAADAPKDNPRSPRKL